MSYTGLETERSGAEENPIDVWGQATAVSGAGWYVNRTAGIARGGWIVNTSVFPSIPRACDGAPSGDKIGMLSRPTAVRHRTARPRSAAPSTDRRRAQAISSPLSAVIETNAVVSALRRRRRGKGCAGTGRISNAASGGKVALLCSTGGMKGEWKLRR